MAISIQFILFLFFCFLLIKSVSLLIRTVSKIAVFFHLTEFTLTFILVALATSLPELFVGISSALNHQSIFSLGNVIGSNIIVLTLVIGIAAVLSRGIRIESAIIRENLLYFIFIPFLSLVMLLDSRLTRLEGGILILFFLFYSLQLYLRGKSFHKIIEAKERQKNKKHILKEFIIFIIELSLILISSHFIVVLGGKIAGQIGFSLFLFSLLFTALGTSLPELVFQTKASIAKHEEMTLGDATGAVVVNSSLVLGLTALINPIIIGNSAYLFLGGMFMIASLFLFVIFTRTKKNLSWLEGIFLIFFYIFFIFLEFLGKI